MQTSDSESSLEYFKSEMVKEIYYDKFEKVYLVRKPEGVEMRNAHDYMTKIVI